MRGSLVLLALVSAGFLAQADPTSITSGIRLPVEPPVPTPVPGPDAVVRLAADQWFVIDSDVPCIVLTSPTGPVSVTDVTGPVTMRGKFVDSRGVETRTYKGKHVYVVEAVKQGTAELLIVPAAATKPDQVIRRTLSVLGARPPPDPIDPKVDPKPVDPKPIDPNIPLPGGGLRVLAMYNDKGLAKLPPEQQSVLFSAKVRTFLNDTCPVGPDGKTKEWRMWPDDTDAGLEAKIWQDALKRTRTSLPWVIVSNGKEFYEGPLPKTVDEMMTLLTKYKP